MFQIPPKLAAYWDRKAKPKATDEDVARIETHLGMELPAPYEEFIRTYGYVTFPDFAYGFTYAVERPGAVERRAGDIAFIRSAERVVKAHSIATSDAPDENLPLIPQGFLPIGSDAGQGMILLELGNHAGRIWYWPERAEAWGSPGNDALGLVAPDMYEFINTLKAYEDGDQ